MPRTRLDQRLLALGLTASREQAQRLIMAGQVLVNGQVLDRPAAPVPDGAEVALKARPRFVSRGGEKLDAALTAFSLGVAGRVCADVGASTGGFTDCLLQRGAARVYAVDVGRGLLDQRLRADPRVVVMEATNARHVARLPEPVAFVSIDAAFISLRLLLPVVAGWLPPAGSPAPQPGDAAGLRGRGDIVALVKPQFEAGRRDAGRGRGVIRDPAIHRRVLEDVLGFALAQGLAVRGLLRSPLTGPKGNAEFLAWLTPGDPTTPLRVEIGGLIERALAVAP
jgi:23S rRNA (cytidine1920-2'-O)/16S rRNA (cytidine1409-2'-O)-methyltransferase